MTEPAASDVTPAAAGLDIDGGNLKSDAAPYLPLVLIDGTGDVWVRDYQDGVDCYWLGGGPPSDAREDALSYAEIKSRYGISTWILSQKSPPS